MCFKVLCFEQRQRESIDILGINFRGNDLEYCHIERETSLILRYIYICVCCLVISRTKYQPSFKPMNRVIITRNYSFFVVSIYHEAIFSDVMLPRYSSCFMARCYSGFWFQVNEEDMTDLSSLFILFNETMEALLSLNIALPLRASDFMSQVKDGSTLLIVNLYVLFFIPQKGWISEAQ